MIDMEDAAAADEIKKTLSETIIALLDQGVITKDQVAIYKLFNGSGARKWLAEVRKNMFMQMPPTLDPQALSFQAGRMDFVREVFQIIDVVNLKVKTRGTECQSYLQQPKQ